MRFPTEQSVVVAAAFFALPAFAAPMPDFPNAPTGSLDAREALENDVYARNFEEDLSARDLNDLYAREAPKNDLYARDFNVLYARDLEQDLYSRSLPALKVRAFPRPARPAPPAGWQPGVSRGGLASNAPAQNPTAQAGRNAHGITVQDLQAGRAALRPVNSPDQLAAGRQAFQNQALNQLQHGSTLPKTPLP